MGSWNWQNCYIHGGRITRPSPRKMSNLALRFHSFPEVPRDEVAYQHSAEITSSQAPMQFINEEPGDKHREKVKKAVRSHVSRGHHRQRRERQMREFQLSNHAKEMEEDSAARPSNQDANAIRDSQVYSSLKPALPYKDNRQ